MALVGVPFKMMYEKEALHRDVFYSACFWSLCFERQEK